MKDNSWLTIYSEKHLYRYSEEEYYQVFLGNNDGPFGSVFSFRENTRGILHSVPVLLPGEVLE